MSAIAAPHMVFIACQWYLTLNIFNSVATAYCGSLYT